MMDNHQSPLLQQCAASYHSEPSSKMRVLTAVNQAVRLVAQEQVSFSCASIDRRCLLRLYRFLDQPDSVQSLVCLSCACTHPYIANTRAPKIKFYAADSEANDRRPLPKFLGLTAKQVEKCFGHE